MKNFTDLNLFGDHVGLVTYKEAKKKLKSPLKESIEDYNGYAMVNDRKIVNDVKDELSAHVVTRRIHDLENDSTSETMDVGFGVVNEMGYLFAKNETEAHYEEEGEPAES